MSQAALRAEVRGDLGATFCDAVVQRAHDLEVLGWVRVDDGVGRVHAEGPAAAVAELRAFLGQRGDVEEQRAKIEGHEQFAIRGVPAGRFEVRERPGGYELRLEVDGAPRAWTLRKAPSMDPAERRMAFQAEPGPGDGPLWDGGPYEQGGRVRWPEAIERGHAVFVLHGDELRGGFALQRTRGAQWLLVKRRDEAATGGAKG